MEDPMQLIEYLTMKDIISEAGPDLLSKTDKHHSEFFRNPDEEVKKKALASFIDHTGNTHTLQSSCVSCAREKFVDDLEGIYINQIPNPHLLTPVFRHHAQSLRKGTKNWDPNALNSGVQGNVSSYQLNTPKIAAMTEGKFLPHRPTLLAAMIRITIVGPKNLPVKSLPSLLSVNRNRVKNALIFLKTQNHLYNDIIISEENLNLLPEDGLPLELFTIIKHSDQEHLLEQEREGYVIGDDDTDDVLANAFTNTSHREKESYSVQHGSTFINEYPRLNTAGERYAGTTENPNHLLGTFPCLFPYGFGGFEIQRPRTISYEAQAKWTMQYSDRRFRKDFHFMFQVFGVIQKREKAFHETEDLATAGREEASGKCPSNPIICSLKKHLSAIRAKVMGTDESRINIRSYIWGMTIMKNPPSLWITINPTDTHDPIAQVFAGEDIDLDNFNCNLGPDSSHRATIIANDPYAAAIFSILEELMGISVSKSKNGHIMRREGIFGTVEGYIGTVEAQGRGTLHLHMLVWLQGAPTAVVMKNRLQSPKFRTKVANYIGANIHAHHTQVTEETLADIPREKAVSYSRPLDPRSAQFTSDHMNTERKLVHAVQVHKCGRGCLKVVKGRILSSEPWINTGGDWGPHRTYAFLNNWNPWILLATQSNHNCKIITNSEDTKHILWYISSYAAKRQQHSSNASALLAKTFAYHRNDERHNTDIHQINKRMVQRCANALSREQEFSAPEVVSYLTGWND
ncbi:hypothetical protein BDR05DRAFT_978863 [Suillus weaverae]|nr:hypothetical protein BDR05DRAFT_978863 [Suillus weaverae]